MSCSRILTTASTNEPLAPCSVTKMLTSSGVMNTPSKVEAEALQMAAGILPRAIDTKAIDDCTVEGSTHRNITPT
ncbi:hypothetical protein D3C72_1589270 [compost metagenome]